MMKYTLLLLLLPALSFAQTEPAPPKKAKKIYVRNTDSTSRLFAKVATILFDKGYSIENKDESIGLISTTDKSLKRFAASVKIRAKVSDSMVVLSGLLALDISIFAPPHKEPQRAEIGGKSEQIHKRV